MKTIEVELKGLQESPFNPRKHYAEAELKELAASIKSVGVLAPILVREKGKSHEIVYGHRRARAATLAGLTTVPAMVRELDDDQVREIQVIENLQRQDVKPLEEGRGYKMLIDSKKHDVEELAQRFGKSTSYIRGRLQLTKLIPEAAKEMEKGSLPLTAALELSKLEPGIQGNVLKNLDDTESPSAMVERIRDSIHKDLKKAEFDTKDAQLVPKAGPCSTCPMRTGSQPDLYEDVSADVCTKPSCFKAKTEAHYEKAILDAKQSGKKVVTGQAAQAAARQLTNLDRGADYPAPGDRSWRSWLGKKGMEEIKDKILLVCQRSDYGDREMNMNEMAPKTAMMTALKNLKVAWAKKSQSSSGSSPKMTKAAKAKAAKKLVVDHALKTEFLRQAGEAAVKAIGSTKADGFLAHLFKEEIENTYIGDDHQAEAEAFGEFPEAEGKKYVYPWAGKRMEKMPFKDLVRLWAVVMAGQNWPGDGNTSRFQDWIKALGFKEKYYRVNIEAEYDRQQEQAGEGPKEKVEKVKAKVVPAGGKNNEAAVAAADRVNKKRAARVKKGAKK